MNDDTPILFLDEMIKRRLDEATMENMRNTPHYSHTAPGISKSHTVVLVEGEADAVAIQALLASQRVGGDVFVVVADRVRPDVPTIDYAAQEGSLTNRIKAVLGEPTLDSSGSMPSEMVRGLVDEIDAILAMEPVDLVPARLTENYCHIRGSKHDHLDRPTHFNPVLTEKRGDHSRKGFYRDFENKRRDGSVRRGKRRGR